MKEDGMQPTDSINLESLIDYVEGSASEATRRQVDQYLDENEEERLVIDGIRVYYQKYGMDRQTMLAYLQDAKTASLSELRERTTINKTFPQWIGWAAAFLVMCLGVVAYLFIGDRNTDPYSITAYLSEPYPVTSFLSGQKSAAWIDAYQTGDYQRSAALLESIVQQQQDDTMLMYYAGLSHLYMRPPQPEPAISYLSQVNEGALVPQSLWYLALAYLLDEQTGKAQSLLQQIVDTQAFQHEEAAELLARLSQE